MGSTRDVRGRGEPFRRAMCGGGVMDKPLGVGELEDVGEAAGEEQPRDGLVTRFGPPDVVALKPERDVSSSEAAPMSTSFRSDWRNDGPGCVGRDGEIGCMLPFV